ncbi:MAG: extracellular solute-binding protein [Clostridia bacterium]|nr:extracellular solute-binding protein [Clostridia bacterium]
MKKRLLALLMTMMLLLPLLTGCVKMQEKAVQITWYLRTEDVELYNRLVGVQVIEEATGVDVVFQSPPDNSEDAYKMMVASGKLPDVIMWSHSAGIDRMYEEGSVIDLTDLIAEYAPNLTKLYTERPELRREVETADGRLYYFPSINPMLTVEDVCRKSYCGLIIRQDWLDKLGLEVPQTIEEWYEVLTAFKLRDPNGNGFQDEIPFDGWGLPYFAPAFGVLNTFCVKTDGTVAFGPMEAEYKAYLETMNKWYAEGLLGPNCLIHSDSWKTENIVNGLTGSFAGLDNAWRYYLPDMQQNDAAAAMSPVAWPMDDAGVRYTPREDVAGHMATTVTVITSACEDPVAAVKFIDYMYSEAGSTLLTWGVEGKSYVVVDGEKQLTELALTPDPEKGWLQLYDYAIGHASFPKYDGETVVLASYPEEQLVAEQTWADASTALIYPPYIPMSVEDRAFCDGVMDDVSNYITEMELKFITGEEPLSNYDAYIAQLERMGMDKVLEIYRSAYAAYMNR